MPKAVRTKKVDAPRKAQMKTSTLPQKVLAAVLKEFVKNADKTKAPGMKKYMRDKFDFYGISSPIRRDIEKKVLKNFTPLARGDLLEIAKLSWAEKHREVQYFASDLTRKYAKVLAGDTEKACLESLEVAKHMLTTKSWWDTVDLLAAHIVGTLAKQQPRAVLKVMDEWIVHEDMWLRRTAILHQLSYKGDTDTDRLFRYCLLCSDEKEFFIRKAIGWALREYFKHDSKAVKQFVSDNADRLSNLSKREALKHD